MSVEVDRLEANVTQITTVPASVVALVNGIVVEIVRLKNDPVKLQAFADALKSNAAALGDACYANTPGAPKTP